MKVEHDDWAAAAARDFLAKAQASIESGEFEFVYDVARTRVWRLVRSNSFGREDHEWFAAIKRISAICHSTGKEEAANVSARFSVLVDLIADTIAFETDHAVADVLRRSHVQKLLKIIRQSGGTIRRSDLLVQSGLKHANLTRLLIVLESSGLISRSSRGGREVEVTLSDGGRTAAAREILLDAKRHLGSSPTPVSIGGLKPRRLLYRTKIGGLPERRRGSGDESLRPAAS